MTTRMSLRFSSDIYKWANNLKFAKRLHGTHSRRVVTLVLTQPHLHMWTTWTCHSAPVHARCNDDGAKRSHHSSPSGPAPVYSLLQSTGSMGPRRLTKPEQAASISDFVSNIFCVNYFTALSAVSVHKYAQEGPINLLRWAQEHLKRDLQWPTAPQHIASKSAVSE